MPSDCPYCGKPHFNFGDDEEGVEMWINEPNDGEYVIVADPPFAWSTPINYCPFCGQPITRNPYTRPDVGSRIRQGVIRCDCGAEMRIHVVSRDAAERWKRLGYHFHPDDVAYGGDDNDVDAVIKFTKDELVKQWNSRSGGNE